MNGLKQINDSKGHEAGDRAIKEVSALILKCLPGSSYLYRLGGDEFAVLFRKIAMPEIDSVIIRLCRELENSPYSCAIGLAQWNSSKSFSEIYNLADERMYEDKKKQKALNVKS